MKKRFKNDPYINIDVSDMNAYYIDKITAYKNINILFAVFFRSFYLITLSPSRVYEKEKKQERKKRNREIFVSLFNEQNYWSDNTQKQKERRRRNFIIFSLIISIFLFSFSLLFLFSFPSIVCLADEIIGRT